MQCKWVYVASTNKLRTPERSELKCVTSAKRVSLLSTFWVSERALWARLEFGLGSGSSRLQRRMA